MPPSPTIGGRGRGGDLPNICWQFPYRLVILFELGKAGKFSGGGRRWWCVPASFVEAFS